MGTSCRMCYCSFSIEWGFYIGRVWCCRSGGSGRSIEQRRGSQQRCEAGRRRQGRGRSVVEGRIEQGWRRERQPQGHGRLGCLQLCMTLRECALGR